MSNKTGLLVNVFRDASGIDCTCGGPTSRFENFILVDEAIDGPFAPIDGMPEVNFVRRVIMGKPYIHAVPASLKGQPTMFGGNFIWTSDSRFREVSQYPVPVHDRVIG